MASESVCLNCSSALEPAYKCLRCVTHVTQRVYHKEDRHTANPTGAMVAVTASVPVAAPGGRRPSLLLACLAFGFQLTHGFVHTGSTARLAQSRPLPLRYYCSLHRRVRSGAVSCTSAVSPEVQQQGEQDREAVPPSGLVHGGDGGDGPDAAVENQQAEHGARGQNTSEGIGKEQAKRSRWPWRRGKKEGQRDEGEGEHAEAGGEVEERGGLFTYDWDNGERIIWKASKRSRAEVVSRFGDRRLHDERLFGGLVWRGKSYPLLAAAGAIYAPPSLYEQHSCACVPQSHQERRRGRVSCNNRCCLSSALPAISRDALGCVL